jgi:hypothetical protein
MGIKEITSIVTACVGVAGLIGLYLTWYNIRGVRLWNTLNAAFTFLPDPLQLESVEGELDKAIGFWRNDSPLDMETVKALIGDLEDSKLESFRKKDANGNSLETLSECRERMIGIGRKLKLYINQIEMYCAGINSGVVDNDLAFHIYFFKFKRHHNKLSNYTTYLRNKIGHKSIFEEFDRVVSTWDNSPSLQRRYR